MELKNVEIKSIGEIQEFGTNNYKVVKWVVVDDTNPDYPQTIELQCTQDKAENLLKYNKPGDRVDVSFNLRGREWTNPETKKTSVFNTIEAWKVFKSDSNTNEIQVNGDTNPFEETRKKATNNSILEEEDDLPF